MSALSVLNFIAQPYVPSAAFLEEAPELQFRGEGEVVHDEVFPGRAEGDLVVAVVLDVDAPAAEQAVLRPTVAIPDGASGWAQPRRTRP